MNILLFCGCILIVLLQLLAVVTFTDHIVLHDDNAEGFNRTCLEFNPYTPLVNCSYLPEEFVKCEFPPLDLDRNESARHELGYGCVKFGAQKYEDVARSRVWCDVLDGIECCGDRHFLSIKTYPCVKYTGHYFVTTLIYSVLLGFLGMDRFCLGHTGTAVGKLLTIGGVGIWWIADIILLVTGELRPADDSSWVPFY